MLLFLCVVTVLTFVVGLSVYVLVSVVTVVTSAFCFVLGTVLVKLPLLYLCCSCWCGDTLFCSCCLLLSVFCALVFLWVPFIIMCFKVTLFLCFGMFR